MRTRMMALVMIGLMAAPTLGVLQFKLTADGPVIGQASYLGWLGDKVALDPGATTTIRLWGMGTSAGVFAFGGSVLAGTGDPVLLTTNPASMVFSPLYSPTGLFTPKPGTAGPNGGRANFGSQQTDWGNPNPDLGRTSYIELCSYTVTAASIGSGLVTLHFVPSTVGGYKPVEVNKSDIIDPQVAVVGIQVTPEPVTLSLLALGGLLVARRRP